MTSEASTARRQLLWHAATFKARCGDLRRLTQFLREHTSEAGTVDFARLADVLDGCLECKRGPAKNPDAYVLAARGKTSRLADLLRASGLPHDVPDLWWIAGRLEEKRGRGRPRKPTLRKAVAQKFNREKVDEFRQRPGYTLERAISEVAKDFGVSESAAKKDYLAWRRSASRPQEVDADDAPEE